jgi:hypothetical protein
MKMAAMAPKFSISRRMSVAKALAGLPRNVLALTEVAISEMPTASQGMLPPPKRKSFRLRFLREK